MSRPEKAIAFLHGILGRGNNLRTISSRFVEARPAWKPLLVDLRGHGESPKGAPGASLEAAARDVIAFAAGFPEPLAALVGHSLGGKVALEAARIGSFETLEHVVVIDSFPGAREPFRGGDNALAVIDTIESLPQTFASKTEFTQALIGRGMSKPVAQWLAQSVEKEGDHFRFALDLGEMRALIMDYFARDLWPVVENPPGKARVHLVIAEQSDSWSPANRERAAQIAASNDRVTVDILPGGHWLHVDNPDGLMRVLFRSCEFPKP